MLERKPFESTRLEEERAKDKRKVLSISLNSDESESVFYLMQVFDTKDMGKALKLGAEIGKNVIQGLKFETLLNRFFINKNLKKHKKHKNLQEL